VARVFTVLALFAIVLVGLASPLQMLTDKDSGEGVVEVKPGVKLVLEVLDDQVKYGLVAVFCLDYLAALELLESVEVVQRHLGFLYIINIHRNFVLLNFLSNSEILKKYINYIFRFSQKLCKLGNL